MITTALPVFEKTVFEYFEEETVRPIKDRPAGRVKAHDSGTGLNGKIVYGLQPITGFRLFSASIFRQDCDPARQFRIDPNSGSIHFRTLFFHLTRN